MTGRLARVFTRARRAARPGDETAAAGQVFTVNPLMTDPARGDIVAPVCAAWQPGSPALLCPHDSCWDVMGLADGPGWWKPADYPDSIGAGGRES